MTWQRGLFTLQNLRTQKVNVNIHVMEIMILLYCIISDICLCTQIHVSMFQILYSASFANCFLARTKGEVTEVSELLKRPDSQIKTSLGPGTT